MTIEQDFETVRDAVELSARFERSMEALALDRIQAEVERLRGDRDNAVEAAEAWHKEAERLRAER